MCEIIPCVLVCFVPWELGLAGQGSILIWKTQRHLHMVLPLDHTGAAIVFKSGSTVRAPTQQTGHEDVSPSHTTRKWSAGLKKSEPGTHCQYCSRTWHQDRGLCSVLRLLVLAPDQREHQTLGHKSLWGLVKAKWYFHHRLWKRTIV